MQLWRNRRTRSELNRRARRLVRSAEAKFYKHFNGKTVKEFPLCRYETPDGVFYEDVQLELPNSKREALLALRDENGNWVRETLWPEKALSHAV